MSEARTLYQLQQIDLKLIRQHKRLQEIAAELDNNEAVATARTSVETARNTLSPHRTRVRDLELEIQSTSEKSKETEERLYSGSVKNPKELQEMQQEIDSLKRRVEDLEGNLLEEMVHVEEAEAALEEAENNLEEVISTQARDHGELLDEQRTLQAEFDALKEQRQTVLQNVTEEGRKTYATMRKRKANKPISPMQGRTCSICGMEQTLAIEQAVRRDQEFVHCQNCGRILVDL